MEIMNRSNNAVIKIGFASIGKIDRWKQQLIFGISMMLFVALINVFVSRNGSAILWQGPRLPLMGSFFITVESIL